MSNPLLNFAKLLVLVTSRVVGSNIAMFFEAFSLISCSFWLTDLMNTLSLCFFFFSEIRGPHLYVPSSLAIAKCAWCLAPAGSRLGLPANHNGKSWSHEYVQRWHKGENITISKQNNG